MSANGRGPGLGRVIDVAKRVIPRPMKRGLRQGALALRGAMARRTGVLPDFLIIGAQKCGTTSLYGVLAEHPCIYAASTKEVGYFDRYYHMGLGWYRAQFPSRFRRHYVRAILRKRFLTGEASTGYILRPQALERISTVVPRAKLILMLRNPVDRAYSHYQHTVRIGVEKLSFEEAISREGERIGRARARMLEDGEYYTLDVARYAYVLTGIYVDQVKVLFSLFPRRQVLILEAEELATDLPRVFRRVLEFLNVPMWMPRRTRWENVGNYQAMDPSCRKELVELFRPHNRRLYDYLGTSFDWDT
jgi:Sulfotransferase domain